MRILVLVILSLSLLSCGSAPKRRMRNCEHLYDNVFDCQEIPEKYRDHR